MDRTAAALTRCSTGARLVTATAVLGGTLALAGLGAFGDPAPALEVDPGISTGHLSHAGATR